ncbi:MAG: hypothetical protein ACRDJF_07015 [Actinomycetota bacterium]
MEVQEDPDEGPALELAARETGDPREPAEDGWRIAAVVDPALAEVWAFIFGQEFRADELAEHLGWLLRMAYLRGYEDGLCEPERGVLFSRLGLSVPARRSRSGCPSRKRTR